MNYPSIDNYTLRSTMERRACLDTYGSRRESSQFLDLQVGDGVTICHWSDKEAATVIKRTSTTVLVQIDNQTLLNGPNSGEPDALQVHPGGFAAHVEGRQRWACSPNPEGRVVKFSRRKDGRWMQAGATNGSTLIAGRYPHYDYNF
jgi:hypothetical protein